MTRFASGVFGERWPDFIECRERRKPWKRGNFKWRGNRRRGKAGGGELRPYKCRGKGGGQGADFFELGGVGCRQIQLGVSG